MPYTTCHSRQGGNPRKYSIRQRRCPSLVLSRNLITQAMSIFYGGFQAIASMKSKKPLNCSSL